MNKLKEIGSCIFFIITYFLLPNNVENIYKYNLIGIIFTSILHHGLCIKSNDKYLGFTIYKHNKQYYKYTLYLDQILITFIYLYNSRFLYKVLNTPFIFIISCLIPLNENGLYFTLLTSFVYLELICIKISVLKSILFLLLFIVKIIIQTQSLKNGWILPIRYFWHFCASSMIYIASYINIAYYLPKTELYNMTNMIVKIVYFALVINFIIYKNTLTDINKNDNNK